MHRTDTLPLRVLALTLLLPLLAPAPVRGAEAVEVSEGTLYGRPVTILDNGLLRLAVTPEIGGRVLSLVDKRSGYEHIRIAEWDMDKNEEDQYKGATYGGLIPMDMRGWPGTFWGKTFDLSVEKGEDGAATVHISHDLPPSRLEQRITLLPGRTRVRIRATTTNIAEYERKVMTRIHGEYRLGEKADNTDYAYWIDPKKGFQQMRYILGTEKTGWRGGYRMRWFQAAGWFAVVDRADATAIVATYPLQEEPASIFWWNGFNEGDPEKPEREETGGFFNFDYMSPATKVASGQSVSGGQDLLLIHGLSLAVRAQNGGHVLAADLDRSTGVYGSNEPIGLRLQSGAAMPAPAVKLTVDVLPKGEESAKKTLRAEVDAVEAGTAKETRVEVPAGLLGDGEYVLRCTARQGDEARGAFEIAFTVDSEAVDAVVAAFASLRAQLRTLAAAAQKLPASTARERLELLTAVARQRETRAGQVLATGDFAATRVALEQLETALASLEADLARAGRNAAAGEADTEAARTVAEYTKRLESGDGN